MVDIESKDKLLLDSIDTFFIKNDIKIMVSIINGESNISLRLLDWFVTNHSKKNNIKYIIDNIYDEQILFDVSADYKGQLKAYNKKYFDPFCRKQRIQYKYNDKFILITTIGQLNFFKWAIQNNIIGYIEDNLTNLEIEMISYYKDKKNKKNDIEQLTNELKLKLIDQSTEESNNTTTCDSIYDMSDTPINNTSINNASINNTSKFLVTFDL
jgi:hypothetical protein